MVTLFAYDASVAGDCCAAGSRHVPYADAVMGKVDDGFSVYSRRRREEMIYCHFSL